MKKGFTLIEVVIALAILAVLYMIVLPSFRSLRNEGNDARARKEIETLEMALASYYKDNGSFPRSVSGTNANLSGYGLSILTTTVPRLIDQLPNNPFYISETYANGKGSYIYHITYVGKTVSVTYLSPSNSLYHILSRGQDRFLDGVSYGSYSVYVFGDDIVVSNAPITRIAGHRPGGAGAYPF